MKKILGLILFISSLCFSQSLVNDSLVYYIDSKRDYQNDLQYALKVRSPYPKKILFNDGNYFFSSAFVVSQSNILLKFSKKAKVLLTNNITGFLIIKGNNITIDNLTLQGNNISAKNFYHGYGILLLGTDGVIIKHSYFSNISGNAIFLMPNKGIGCTNNIISDNVINSSAFNISKNGDEAAILLGYSGNGYFHENNIIKNNIIDGGNKLKVGIGIIAHGRNNTIENNSVSNLLAYGIIAYESQYVENTLTGTKIIGNKVSNIGEMGSNRTVKGMGIYLQKSHNSIVQNNIVTNVLRNSDRTETLGQGAISLAAAVNIIVENNIINGSEMYGIVASYADGSKILNNKISKIQKSGVYLINLNNVLVQKNTFSNIKEVVFKGFFGNTSNTIYAQNRPLIKNQNTGHSITLSYNIINSPSIVLNFTGQSDAKNFLGNNIYGNVFENNTINNAVLPIEKLVIFQKQKYNSNIVRNNKLK